MIDYAKLLENALSGNNSGSNGSNVTQNKPVSVEKKGGINYAQLLANALSGNNSGSNSSNVTQNIGATNNKRGSLSQNCDSIIFVDTETTGIPIDSTASFKNIDNWPNIFQIAWLVYKKDGTFESSYNYAISNVTASSTSAAPRYKPRIIQPIHIILNQFLNTLNCCDVIIGHNIEYDVSVILCELYRYGMDTSRLESMQQFCTMKNSVEICGFDTSLGDRYPKLQELYSRLFHHPFANAHDAYCDIKATADCFWEMLSKQLIHKEDYPFLLASTEIDGFADKYINSAVEIVDRYVNRDSRINDEQPLEALTLFDKALSLRPYSSSLKEKVGKACLECGREIYTGGSIRVSSLFFKKASETDYGEALMVQSDCVRDNNEKESLLLRAIDKDWIDAAYYLYYFYKKRGNLVSAKKYSEMWLRYCERNFSSLPFGMCVRYIGIYLYGYMGHSVDLNKAKLLCERSIRNGHDCYSLYEEALELSCEWEKRFEVLNAGYKKYMDMIKQHGGLKTIKERERSSERSGIIKRLSGIVECLFEGIGTALDYNEAKKLIDFGVDLYDSLYNREVKNEVRKMYYYLGQYCENGLAGVTIDYEKALDYYERASESVPLAAKQLGIMHLKGLGCKKNKKQAREYLTRAKNNGIDVSPYLEKANSWF